MLTAQALRELRARCPSRSSGARCVPTSPFQSHDYTLNFRWTAGQCCRVIAAGPRWRRSRQPSGHFTRTAAPSPGYQVRVSGKLHSNLLKVTIPCSHSHKTPYERAE